MQPQHLPDRHHHPRSEPAIRPRPADKSVRVASFHRNLTHEIGLIAHSCGVRSPRASPSPCLRGAGHRSVLLDELFPTPSVRVAPAPSSRSSGNTASPAGARRERLGAYEYAARLRRMPGFPQSPSPASGVAATRKRRETPSGRSIRARCRPLLAMFVTALAPFRSSPW